MNRKLDPAPGFFRGNEGQSGIQSECANFLRRNPKRTDAAPSPSKMLVDGSGMAVNSKALTLPTASPSETRLTKAIVGFAAGA